MKRARIHVLCFAVILAAVSVYNAIQMTSAPAVLDAENRTRAPWPALSFSGLTDGTFTRHLEDAFADRFILREQALVAGDFLNSLKGLPAPEAEIFAANTETVAVEKASKNGPVTVTAAGDARIVMATVPEHEGAASTATKPAVPAAVLPEDGSVVNYFLIVNKRGYETASYSPAVAQAYGDAVNNLASKLPESVKIYAVIVPSAIQFLSDPKYKGFAYPQDKAIASFYATLSPRITAIDVIPALAPHADEYIYHHTDHHWTGLGAYYAYVAASPYLGIEPYSYDEYPKETVTDFRGSIYSRSRSRTLFANPDTMEVVFPFVDHVFYVSTDKEPETVTRKAVEQSFIRNDNKYLIYMRGDYPQAEVVSSVKNGRKILILKDSYANAFIPYLIPYFEEIHIIDPRYWKGSVPEYVEEHGIQEVMVFNYYLIVGANAGMAHFIEKVSETP